MTPTVPQDYSFDVRVIGFGGWRKFVLFVAIKESTIFLLKNLLTFPSFIKNYEYNACVTISAVKT